MRGQAPSCLPPEQAPDPADLQAVAEPLVNLAGAAAMSVAAITIGLCRFGCEGDEGPAGGPSQSARRGNRTTVKEGSSYSDYSGVFPETEDQLAARRYLRLAEGGKELGPPPG